MAKEIPLTQGKYAIVDDEDFEELNRYKWYAHKDKNTFYAMRHVTKEEAKKEGRSTRDTTIYMHQQILGKKEGYQIDHVNGNGSDNRRKNLRYVTNRQNAQNRHINKSSQYPGVSWHKQSQKWRMRIRINGKEIHLGLFTNEYDAFLAYKNAVKTLTGQEVI